jgi:hypothetical protein
VSKNSFIRWVKFSNKSPMMGLLSLTWVKTIRRRTTTKIKHSEKLKMLNISYASIYLIQNTMEKHITCHSSSRNRDKYTIGQVWKIHITLLHVDETSPATIPHTCTIIISYINLQVTCLEKKTTYCNHMSRVTTKPT